jgi:hypothetical protein
MGERLVRAMVAIVLLLAFVADLRVAAVVVAALLVAAAWRHVVLSRAECVLGAVALAGATLAFQTDHEVAAWTLVLAVAAVAGVAAIATGRSAGARRGVGSSSPAR